MTTETASRQQPEARTDLRSPAPYQAAQIMVVLLLLVAVASVVGGFIVAGDAKHSNLWIAAGIVEAIGFLTTAVLVYLIREIAINTKRS